MEKNERYISTCIYVSSSSKRGFSFGNIVWKEKEREEKVRKISKTVQDESCGVGRGARRYIVGKGREGGCAAYSSLSHSLSQAGAERRRGGGGRRKEERLFPREARNAVVYAYSLCAGCVPPAE